MLEDVHRQLGLHGHAVAQPPPILVLAWEHVHIGSNREAWIVVLSRVLDVLEHLLDVYGWGGVGSRGILGDLAIPPFD